MPQDERDRVGAELLRITLRELFEFRFMQTDPNFANFLYDSPSKQLTLIDFGAAKSYAKPFVDELLKVVPENPGGEAPRPRSGRFDGQGPDPFCDGGHFWRPISILDPHFSCVFGGRVVASVVRPVSRSFFRPDPHTRCPFLTHFLSLLPIVGDIFWLPTFARSP